MTGHKQKLRSESWVGWFIWQVDYVHVAVPLVNRVYLDTKAKVLRDPEYLRLVTLHIQLLYFSQAELSYIANEVFKENGIRLQVSRCHESCVHYDVVCVLMVAKHVETMLGSVFRFNILQLLRRFDEDIVKVLNGNLVIPSVFHEVFLAIN